MNPPKSEPRFAVTPRQMKLSEARAHFAIKQQQVAQLGHAIEALADPKVADDIALKVADKILNSNFGP
jgi:hypothetical protein